MEKKKINIADAITAGAALMGMIATFLPWLSASVLGMTVAVNGSEGDGWISFVLFMAVLGVAIYSIFKEAKWAKILISILSAIAFLIAAIKIPDAVSNNFTVGIGIYLVMIAGLACAIAPWIRIKKQ